MNMNIIGQFSIIDHSHSVPINLKIYYSIGVEDVLNNIKVTNVDDAP
jgi:hypothetical protein